MSTCIANIVTNAPKKCFQKSLKIEAAIFCEEQFFFNIFFWCTLSQNYVNSFGMY